MNINLLSQTADSPGIGLLVIGFLVCGAVLGRAWMLVRDYHHEDRDDPPEEGFAKSMRIVLTSVVCTAILFVLFLKTLGGIAPFDGPEGPMRAAIFFGFAGVVSILAQHKWEQAKHYTFALAVGTLITFILLGFKRALFSGAASQDPFMLAIGLICVVISWKFLFGPWRPQVKATVLATFIFWVALNMFWREPEAMRTAHLLATLVAIIPAIIWCLLFLHDHKQRLSLVFLMFMAGMLSTAPILFYDKLVRGGVELQFFLFKITPENFTRTSNAFINGNLMGISGIRSTLAATLLAFLIVGMIEEFSKYWVLKKSGQRFFSSIDDVMQLAIIVAIGFAFAENVMNPTYFVAFVREYLMGTGAANWGGFVGNVLGRAILTNMVHILSTGVIGYFYGLSLFAGPYLRETSEQGIGQGLARLLNRLFRLPTKAVFRRQMMTIGLLSAFILHGMFNFLVTLPDLLPGNPRTLGDLMGAAPDSPLHYIALLIIPSLFYVVGGFWLLSVLFYRKECMKERGCLVTVDTFVKKEKVMAAT